MLYAYFHMLIFPFSHNSPILFHICLFCRKVALIMLKSSFLALLIVHHNASVDIYIYILYNNHFNV